MKIKRVSWQETIPIRHQVLWPDKSPEFCRVDGDQQAEHFSAEVEGELVCVASIYIDKPTARLRKFATLRSHQGKGVGSTILRYVISQLRESGHSYLWLDARESAIDFYKRLGFDVAGERFFKQDVPYFKMYMNL